MCLPPRAVRAASTAATSAVDAKRFNSVDNLYEANRLQGVEGDDKRAFTYFVLVRRTRTRTSAHASRGRRAPSSCRNATSCCGARAGRRALPVRLRCTLGSDQRHHDAVRLG
ncbi:hypothetical protein EON67_08585 [archaeon]|nr:MAG: hypothetical protein EON67_08585 [archaeon]